MCLLTRSANKGSISLEPCSLVAPSSLYLPLLISATVWAKASATALKLLCNCSTDLDPFLGVAVEGVASSEGLGTGTCCSLDGLSSSLVLGTGSGSVTLGSSVFEDEGASE